MSNNLRGTATLVWMTRALITRSLCDHATELLMFLLNRCSFNVKKHFYHFIFRYKVPPAHCSDHDEAGAPGQAQQDRARHEEAELLGEAQTRRCADHGSREDCSEDSDVNRRILLLLKYD